MKSISLLLVMLIMSCSSYKNNSKTNKETAAMNESKTMLAEGYLAGTIVTSEKEGDCPYKIEVNGADGKYFLDPTNLEADFQKDGQKIWFKFTGLRMMNRCENASPISLNEIQKRAE